MFTLAAIIIVGILGIVFGTVFGFITSAILGSGKQSELEEVLIISKAEVRKLEGQMAALITEDDEIRVAQIRFSWRMKLGIERAVWVGDVMPNSEVTPNSGDARPKFKAKPCSFYVAGQDTSESCNNCGHSKWSHQ